MEDTKKLEQYRLFVYILVFGNFVSLTIKERYK